MAREIHFSPEGWEDYLYWQSEDAAKFARLNTIIGEIARQPFKGLGKPEPLRHEYAGFWSRRIDQEHRVIYKVDARSVFIAQCRYHYGNK